MALTELEIYKEVREKGTVFVEHPPNSRMWSKRVQVERQRNPLFDIYAYHRPAKGGTYLSVYRCIQGVEKGPPRKNQYKQYVDGKTHRLQQGVDFPQNPYRFYRNLHRFCSTRGYKLYATWNTKEGWIEFVIDTGIRRRF